MKKVVYKATYATHVIRAMTYWYNRTMNRVADDAGIGSASITNIMRGKMGFNKHATKCFSERYRQDPATFTDTNIVAMKVRDAVLAALPKDVDHLTLSAVLSELSMGVVSGVYSVNAISALTDLAMRSVRMDDKVEYVFVMDSKCKIKLITLKDHVYYIDPLLSATSPLDREMVTIEINIHGLRKIRKYEKQPHEHVIKYKDIAFGDTPSFGFHSAVDGAMKVIEMRKYDASIDKSVV